MKLWAAVCRLGGCGDNLVASSVLPLLARNYHVEVICQRPWHVVFENNPWIDKLTALDEGHIPAQAGVLEWQDWFDRRAKEYEKFIHLSHSIEIELALVPAQSQFRWNPEVRRWRCGHSYLEYAHRIAGVPFEFAPNFFPTQEEIDQADDTKRKVGDEVIGWHVSGSRIDKIYPAAGTTIARLIKEVHRPVILFGGGEKDSALGSEIEKIVARQNGSIEGLHSAISPTLEEIKARGEVKDGALRIPDGKETWPLRRSLTQLQRCDLVIGPDTGSLWSVAMHNLPKIVLLSHASSENITKHWVNTITLHADPERVSCWPCHMLHDRIETCTPNKDGTGAACISDISPDAIVDHAKRLLNKGRMQLVTPIPSLEGAA